jgi:hypothetical protein
MNQELDILPNSTKFLTYYYLKFGWICNSKIITQVTDLTQQEILLIKNNWAILYKTYIMNMMEILIQMLILQLELVQLRTLLIN